MAASSSCKACQQILQKAVQAVIHLHGVYGAGARAGDVDGVDHGQHHAVHLAADLQRCVSEAQSRICYVNSIIQKKGSES